MNARNRVILGAFALFFPAVAHAQQMGGGVCNTQQDCENGLACIAGLCQPPPPPPPPPPVYIAPVYQRPRDVYVPPSLDTTRAWHFTEVATYDASMSGLGDFFTFDILFLKLGDLNSSLSVGAGVGFIYSVAANNNFTIPIPIAFTWRYGFGSSIEMDLKAGVAPYYYTTGSHDLWDVKFLAGLSFRIPFSNTGGAGFIFGVETYINKYIATLPEVGFTF